VYALPESVGVYGAESGAAAKGELGMTYALLFLALLLLYLGISGTVFWTALSGRPGGSSDLGNARPPLSVFDTETSLAHIPDYPPEPGKWPAFIGDEEVAA
jgi:hypothetical protein